MTGPETGSPPSGPKLDRALAHFDAAADRVWARLKSAWLTGDQVAAADARGSLVDLRTAAHIRGGAAPADLDANGWPTRVQPTFHQGAAQMPNVLDPDGTVPTGGKGHPDPTQPHPQPSDPGAPPPPVR